MGVLLQGFFFDVRTASTVAWWDHLAGQAQDLARAGFTAIWLPPPLKGASGASSNGYDPFDDYDLGSKDQKKTVATHYGSREQLQRCVAMMRANALDIYIDLVENQRDGDDGLFNFAYTDAFGNNRGGRFSKGPTDFHPHVPADPGVFSDQFSFGRDLAPINGGNPKGRCGEQLIDSADWLTRALDIQGYRLDNTKGVSTVFINELLHAKSMAGKFAVGEFADGNIQNLQNWANAVQHRASSFDFPLHFMLKDMCNNSGTFQMFSLDHAGLAGVDPLGAVTFVENHDTDRGGIGGPVVRNKLLAYAYILTSEGYPCVFYRDYSTDPNCFGLKPQIDRLIWIHENVAAGPTLQRWKDSGVFAYERLGGSHLLVGLNKDEGTTRTIIVQTGFQPDQELQNLVGDNADRIRTDIQSKVKITIPKNREGRGYVCYGLPVGIKPFERTSLTTTQEFQGAADLDIKPAVPGQSIPVCRIFPEPKTSLNVRLTANTADWSPATSLLVTVHTPDGTNAGSKAFDRSAQGSSFSVEIKNNGFHAITIEAANTPEHNHQPDFSIAATYRAPQTL